LSFQSDITSMTITKIRTRLADQKQPGRVEFSDDIGEATQTLLSWYNSLIELLLKVENRGGTDKEQLFYSAELFSDFMRREVEKFKAKGNYDQLSEFVYRCEDIIEETDMIVGALCNDLAACVFALLGDSTHMLVGVQDNKPAFKTMSAITQPLKLLQYLERITVATAGGMEHVGPDDAWLVPDPRHLDIATFMNADDNQDHLQASAALIEEAFYGQRYLVDPEGVYVKISNHPTITGVSLKVKAARQPGALVDILARVEMGDRHAFTIITEEKLLDPKSTTQGPTLSIGSESTLVVCQIYRDLVMATSVPTPKTKRQAQTGVGIPKMPLAGTTTRWTVIPRRVRTKNAQQVPQVRTIIPNATPIEPRRISGHPRRVPMTPQHRAALEKMEQESGLQILRFLDPTKETFVRPHFVPALTSPDDIKKLPRFARHQMQQALQKSIQRLRNERE